MNTLTELIAGLEAFDGQIGGVYAPWEIQLAEHLSIALVNVTKLVTSIDAVIALINERLPGALGTLAWGDGSSYAHITTADRTIQAGGEARTDACALLIAALKAMEPS